ncbi:PHD finger protein 10, partial [Geodia barretti]
TLARVLVQHIGYQHNICFPCYRYTSEELSALPLNTATKLPEKLPDAPLPPHHQDYSTASQCTSSSTSVLQPSSASLSTSVTITPPGTGSQQTAETSASDAVRLASITTTKVSQSGMVCSVCYRGRATVKQDKPEPLLQCSHCQGNIHPSCLGMSSEAAEVALTYPWQCLECKTCSVCGDPGGEEEMVFCDHCDRGYHTFCLDMKGIPEGQWLCMECCECAICGTESGRGDRNQWRHEFINNKFLHTLCLDCAKI